LIKTINNNWLKLIFRCYVFFVIVSIYAIDKPLLQDIKNFPIAGNFTLLHLLWIVLMIDMLRQFFPGLKSNIGCAKQNKSKYQPPETPYQEAKLYEYTVKNNAHAIVVLMVWLGMVAVLGFLFLFGIVGGEGLLLASVFFYLCDMICVIFWCPFQHFIMKNKCCATCRIFAWDYFMIFSPLLFIPSFYTWSLLFMAIILMLRWEYIHAAHPERFWQGSNAALHCTNCSSHCCRIKKRSKTVLEATDK